MIKPEILFLNEFKSIFHDKTHPSNYRSEPEECECHEGDQATQGKLFQRSAAFLDTEKLMSITDLSTSMGGDPMSQELYGIGAVRNISNHADC